MSSYFFTERFSPQGVLEISSTAQETVGAEIKAVDSNGVEHVFVYLAGVASTAAGDVVTFNESTGVTTRLAATGAIGKIAVAMAATVASTYGWYMVKGRVAAKSAAGGTADKLMFSQATATIDDSGSAGDEIYNMVSLAATASDKILVSLDYPYIV